MIINNKILNEYDIGVIINSLIFMRNYLRNEQKDTSLVEAALIKMINISKNKKLNFKIDDSR